MWPYSVGGLSQRARRARALWTALTAPLLLIGVLRLVFAPGLSSLVLLVLFAGAAACAVAAAGAGAVAGSGAGSDRTVAGSGQQAGYLVAAVVLFVGGLLSLTQLS